MLKFLRSGALFVALATTSIFIPLDRAKAQSYQIDCAILLCLSGGWPPSVPCARARAEFIRRITPWPIEPPLQIWRCPMGVAFEADPSELSIPQMFDVLMDQEQPLQSFPSASLTEFELQPKPVVFRRSGGTARRLPEGTMLQLIQDYSEDNGRADIDISGPEFNFVRSIRVFHAQFRQNEGRDECRRWSSVLMGRYGTQGDYGWHRSYMGALPSAFVGNERWGQDCPSVGGRAVFVDWRDYEGNYGFEQVNY